MNHERLHRELAEAKVPDSRDAERRTIVAAQAAVAGRGRRPARAQALRPGLWIRLRGAAVLAAAGAVAAVVVLALGMGGDSTAPARADSFPALASLAAEQPQAEVQRIRSEVGLDSQSGLSYLVDGWFTPERSYERWTATRPDGERLFSEDRLIDARSGVACVIREGEPAPRCFEPWDGGSAEPLLPSTPDLPTDPDRLRAALVRVDPPFKPLFGAFGLATGFGDDGLQVSRRSDAHAFVAASYLLWHPLASPELRSALFEVLGELDGVALRTGAEDRSGREAVAVSLSPEQGEVSYELFLDPRSSYLLELRVIGARGRELGYELYDRSSAAAFPADVGPIRDALDAAIRDQPAPGGAG